MYLFVAYDGQYYLSCSDWNKEVPLGSVFDASFTDVMLAKLEHVRTRRPVCHTCNLDPLNKLTEALRDRDAGDLDDAGIDETIEKIRRMSAFSLAEIERLTGERAPGPTDEVRSPRRTIPVTAL